MFAAGGPVSPHRARAAVTLRTPLLKMQTMPSSSDIQHHVSAIATRLHRAFDATTTWVTQLSWWKFFLFAVVALVAADILQNELFSGSGEEVVVRADDGK